MASCLHAHSRRPPSSTHARTRQSHALLTRTGSAPHGLCCYRSHTARSHSAAPAREPGARRHRVATTAPPPPPAGRANSRRAGAPFGDAAAAPRPSPAIAPAREIARYRHVSRRGCGCGHRPLDMAFATCTRRARVQGICGARKHSRRRRRARALSCRAHAHMLIDHGIAHVYLQEALQLLLYPFDHQLARARPAAARDLAEDLYGAVLFAAQRVDQLVAHLEGADAWPLPLLGGAAQVGPHHRMRALGPRRHGACALRAAATAGRGAAAGRWLGWRKAAAAGHDRVARFPLNHLDGACTLEALDRRGQPPQLVDVLLVRALERPELRGARRLAHFHDDNQVVVSLQLEQRLLLRSVEVVYGANVFGLEHGVEGRRPVNRAGSRRDHRCGTLR